MRNLKRTLSLALAAVMLMGMMVIGAGAASYDDFTDKDEIKNVEAVMVMNALGILEGGDKGAFVPNGILTREQAAKIVCYMLLGKETAAKLSTNSTVFKDVAADRWSAAYIGYCVNMGILAGDGNGNFFPEAELTGAAFAKMVLVALGKDAKEEGYVGSEWTINVAVDATEMGLVPDGLVLTNPMTREQAAQMAFDGLFYTDKDASKKTVYRIIVDNDGSSPNSMDAVAGVSYDSFTEAYLMAQSAAANDDVWHVEKVETTDATGSLASEVFKLSKSTTTDEFERPATSYVSTKKDNKVDLVVADEADYTFEGKVTNKELYAAVGSEVATKYTWTNYTDGANSNNSKPTKTGTGAFNSIAAGMTTEVFVDSDNKTVTVSTINTYVGEVKKVTEADAGDARYVTLTDGKTFETENFAKKDVVLYTYSQKQVGAPAADAGVQSMTLAEVVTGNLDKVVTKGTSTTYTVDGTEYEVSAKGSTSLTGASLNKEVSFYVDAQGNIMKDKSAAETENSYIYVVANGIAKNNEDYLTGSGATYTAEVYGVLADGTVGTYTVDLANNTGWTTANGKTGLYTYETNSDTGNLELTSADTTADNAAIAVKAAKETTSRAILNSETVFVFVETKSATNNTVENTVVKVGNANIGSTIAANTAFIGVEDGVAEVVFVNAAYTDASTDTGDYAYVDHTTEETVTSKVDGATKTQYTYTAYTTEGDEITLTSDTRIGSSDVYKYNEDMTVGAQKASASGVVTAINGSAVTIGGTTYLNLTDDTTEAFLGDDVELLVGQTITYVVGSDDAINDIQALWVTADQATYALTLETTAVDTDYNVTTDASDVIGGTGVVNTVKITVEKKVGTFNANKAITLTASGTGVAVVGPVTPAAATNTVTFEVTVTAPSAATEITISGVSQAS